MSFFLFVSLRYRGWGGGWEGEDGEEGRGMGDGAGGEGMEG